MGLFLKRLVQFLDSTVNNFHEEQLLANDLCFLWEVLRIYCNNKKRVDFMAILVTGGAGYIGSHTCVELLNAGFDVVVVDNLDNSSKLAIDAIEEVSGKSVRFYNCDVRDAKELEKVFSENTIEAVIHFAGLKAVGESVREPIMYYNNNLISTIILLETMTKYSVKRFIFSSSATVYGTNTTMPLVETMDLGAINPYGRTKLFIEEMLRDLYLSDSSWSVALLRYFNPIGAHPSGIMGENPRGIPNNLMPYIAQVAVGNLEKLHVFGNDYNTVDGTGVRDYIHVVDLAKGHVRALEWALKNIGCEAFNLGTGNGTSVLQLRDAFVKASGVDIPFVIDPRRPGDPDTVYADAQKAKEVLGWETDFGIDEMCADTWRWQSAHPNGYDN